MTDQDNLRDRMADIISEALDTWEPLGGTTEDIFVAQAIIDEFGMTVEYEQSWFVGLRDANGLLIKDATAKRVVGKWVEQ